MKHHTSFAFGRKKRSRKSTVAKKPSDKRKIESEENVNPGLSASGGDFHSSFARKLQLFGGDGATAAGSAVAGPVTCPQAGKYLFIYKTKIQKNTREVK